MRRITEEKNEVTFIEEQHDIQGAIAILKHPTPFQDYPRNIRDQMRLEIVWFAGHRCPRHDVSNSDARLSISHLASKTSELLCEETGAPLHDHVSVQSCRQRDCVSTFKTL